MPRQIEPNANNALGSLLQNMLPRSEVRSENTQAVTGHAGLKPDILITAAGRSPVVIEAEYMPARTVEPEAKSRLGLEVAANGRIIEASIALRYPAAVGDAHDLHAALSPARLDYCVFTEGTEGMERFPESGWLEGGVEDLADLVRLVSVPQRAVDLAADTLQEGIESAAKMLDEMAKTRDGITRDIAHLLGMIDVPQTRRMACAIIANALVFHERIAGMHSGIKPLAAVCGDNEANPQGETLAAWDAILNINYWAIFAIAKDILEQLPSGEAASILRRLRDTAQSVRATGVDNAHDLTGRIFQRLIADRKYLATFYTLPASAALLARLAVAKMEGVDWSDAEAIGKLRIADFACGTGALLSAAYEEVAARHERAGGDPAKLHKVMMEEVLYGCDVMPSAVHITGSTLSGVEPSVLFNSSHLYTMPYGRMRDGTVKLGSLELLKSSNVLTLFNTSDPALRTGSTGEETATQILAEFPDEGYDLVIMNPPFTSNTAKDVPHVGTFAPAFAAFEASEADQREMSKRMGKLKKGTCYHGHAGMASAFAGLANKKLKPGGVLALVLPVTAASASSWQSFREMINNNYSNLKILSIAANGRDMSFSSDTDIAECLLIAEKEEESVGRGRFISLRRRPHSHAEASHIAKSLTATQQIRAIEDGPLGGTLHTTGHEVVGESLSVATGSDKRAWDTLRVADLSLAQTAFELGRSQLWPPGLAQPLNLKTCRLDEVGTMGLYDLDIVGAPPQGPFDKASYSPTATYPALWNHDAAKESYIVCSPDMQLKVRHGMESKAKVVWATSSRLHLARGFRFTSQPLAVALTDTPSIGGTAWPNVSLSKSTFEVAFALWSNSTLGLLLFWWNASRQQDGRGWMAIRAADHLTVLDFRALTDAQLAKAQEIFDEFRDKELQPAYLADADANRALLDRRVVCDLLGFDEETFAGVRRLAAKWCAEPSVHGGKARPKGSALVI